MTDIVPRLRADADRWMAGDMGRDNEEAGLLSDEAANEIERLRDALKIAREALERVVAIGDAPAVIPQGKVSPSTWALQADAKIGWELVMIFPKIRKALEQSK